ncbi:putative Ubiquitin-conjugating enzyme E2 R2 [Hypsibius exemplaris]|uniref:Ubiquitin-conjugating enzyme E2 R2 n=1 Tax=Hypsibius exemplaris TaxID=2072580 RepID=A0A1W0WA35_HYPEX|nr:putative Ubiquitin-conjugating enzyme E2 R2 [Hypsibius exemplaris]
MSNGSSSSQPHHVRAQKVNPANQQAARVLMQEMQILQKERTEGFTVKLVQEDNLFEWEAGIFGFPPGYPFSPPTVHFLTKMWHPNVYANGSVCISILHPQTDNQRSGELPSERWNPTQNAYSVLMSIISLLNEPNTNSPANVEASIMYRRWKEKGDKEYEKIIKEQVETSRVEAEKEGIHVPSTLAEYCVPKPATVEKPLVASMSEFDFSDDTEPLDSYSDDEAVITNKPPSPTGGPGQSHDVVISSPRT